ncbi:RNA polymerase sigma factor [Rhodothermus profundi]|uniref:Sigma-70 region 2 n=1 Tax=Rhodothermus profundi TaxID=633813 RepID=A0A1M6R6F9_9BACT|nr:sigma-70 family RNA polymerase sigma factor [Rhodothermus profundi]SHK28006.1 Sigma-70 region 2 [Rhodothermus profundi]
MAVYSDLGGLDALAARLPFHIDDQAAVLALYERWRAFRQAADYAQLELWLYCFVGRYFFIRAIREPHLSEVELEQLIGDTFLRLRSQLDSVREPERFVSWVGTSCRNAFLNYLRSVRRRPQPMPDDSPFEEPEVEAHLERHDLARLLPLVAAAIERLPEFLREVARLALLQGLSYTEISQRLNRSPGTVRVYLSRAFRRLREDPRLQEFL